MGAQDFGSAAEEVTLAVANRREDQAMAKEPSVTPKDGASVQATSVTISASLPGTGEKAFRPSATRFGIAAELLPTGQNIGVTITTYSNNFFAFSEYEYKYSENGWLKALGLLFHDSIFQPHSIKSDAQKTNSSVSVRKLIDISK